MADFGNSGWQGVAYAPAQVEVTLRQIGVDVDGEGPKYFTCFCPYHGNRLTPSFTVNRISGTYMCLNPSCGVKGSLVELVKNQTGKNEFAARRQIQLNQNSDVAIDMQRVLETPKFVEFSQKKIDLLADDFWKSSEAINYMYERGFFNTALHEFEIGYSEKQGLVTVPMHDPGGMPVGVIGRSITQKRFKNSNKLPSPRTLWNFHRAKKHNDAVVIVEASFDAMRVHQAGHPCVVACLMGYFSPYHVEQIDKHFDTVIIMTDFDDKEKHKYIDCIKCRGRGLSACAGHNPGRDLGFSIAKQLPSKEILWAYYSDHQVYPNMAKDAGDMTDDQIKYCIDNAVTDLYYRNSGIMY